MHCLKRPRVTQRVCVQDALLTHEQLLRTCVHTAKAQNPIAHSEARRLGWSIGAYAVDKGEGSGDRFTHTIARWGRQFLNSTLLSALRCSRLARRCAISNH